MMLAEIQADPEHFGRHRGETRAAPLPKSHFIVYYRIYPDSVAVIAVQHERANPRRLRGRK